MVAFSQIETFFASQPIAMAGVSRNPRKFGYAAFKELREKGLNVIPVNPAASNIMGISAYPDISSLPPDVHGLIVMTRKEQTANIIRAAKNKGLKNIWIQQSSETKEALNELGGSDINYIHGECVLMYYKPHSFHKFHRALKKLFGKYPK